MFGTLFQVDEEEPGVVPEATDKFGGRPDKLVVASYMLSYVGGTLFNPADAEAEIELPGFWIEPGKLVACSTWWLVNWLCELAWELFHAPVGSI